MTRQLVRVVVLAAVLATVPATAVAEPFAQAKLVNPGGTSGDGLAFATAISADGSTIAAGAPGTASLQGAVLVFQRSGPGWAQPVTLLAPDGAASDQLGSSVAVSSDGSVIAAGAPDSASGGTQRGSVYVFVRGPSGWSSGVQAFKLTVGTAANYTRLGHSVGISGNGSEIVAGAPGAGSNQGAVFVFDQSSGAWANQSTPAETLTVNGGAAGDGLGTSVAVSSDGSVVVAGAPGVGSGTGAAYVFEPPMLVNENWLQSTLTASSGSAGDELGMSVATTGTEVIAGAPGVSSSKGAAYVFVKPRPLTVLQDYWRNTTESARLSATGAGAGDGLGMAVAVAPGGSPVIAGAPTTTNAVTAATGPGSAYVFAGAGSNWTNGPQVTAADGVSGDALGWSVGISTQGLAVVGSPRATIGSDAKQGAAYVFTASSSTAIDCQPVLVVVGTPATCTATVTDEGSGAIAPVGPVSFATDSPGLFSGNALGTFHEGPHCNLTATATPGTATCQITYTPTALATGTDTITGAYGGDTGHDASQGLTQLGVELAGTTAAVRCSPGSVAVGLATRCLATVIDVTGGDPTPGGTVTFITDSRGSFGSLHTCTLESGSCSVSYTPLAVGSFGTHEISVRYAGDAGHASSFGTTQLRVTRGETASSIDCRRIKRRLACVVTVAEKRAGTSTPTGAVSFTAPVFLRGRGSCRLRATRRAGIASCRVTFTVGKAGRGRITTGYAGDPNHFGSTGAIRLRAIRRGGSK